MDRADPRSAHWNDLLDTLEHCSTRVPLYRGLPAPDRALEPQHAARRALARFPLLRKDALRAAFPLGLVPDDRRLPDALRAGEVAFVGTSGTTEERVQVLWHQPWWDAQERAGFAIHPLTDRCAGAPDYREAVLTTPVCSGNLCHVGRLAMSERVVAGSMLFLNQTPDPALWSDAEVLRMADELDEFRPQALECDPAYLAHFATRLAKLGRRPYQPAFVDHSYEYPSRRHLAAIAQAFDVPILDAYGSTECGFAFMQCAAGRYHHNEGWSHAEILPLDDRPGLEGIGRLLLTPLRNPWLNLVRFDTGDLVRPARDACPCGRSEALVLDALEGRAADLLLREDGRLLTVRTVDRALADADGLLNWRLRQRGPTDFELDLLPTGLGPLDAAAVAEGLATVLGAVPRTRVVASLPVEASGKYRLCQATHVDAARLAVGGP